MATDAKSLLSSAACFNNFSAQTWLLRLGLLRQIVLNASPSADVSPQGLLTAAQCYNCYGPGVWPLLKLGLLMLIVQGGGGGVTPVPPTCVMVSGAGTSRANGTYEVDGQVNGRNNYSQVAGDSLIFWEFTGWVLLLTDTGTGSGAYRSTGDAATPDLATGWSVAFNVSNPPPTVTHC